MATRQIAEGLASLGRNGDTMLMHVQPQEVAGLQALANANGTTLTVNPHTGLPEAFSLGSFFNSLLPTIAGFGASAMSGGTLTPMMAGILAGAGTGALTNKEDPLMGALMGGLGGYGGANIASSLMGAKAAGIGGVDITSPAAQSAVNTGGLQPGVSNIGQDFAAGVKLNPEVIGQANNWGLNVADPGVQDALLSEFGRTSGTPVLPGDLNYTGGAFNGMNTMTAGQGISAVPGGTQFGSVGEGMQAAMENPGAYYDSIGGAMGTAKLYGMPLATAALGGLEPSDLGYGDINTAEASQAGKYNPYARLNLGGPSSRGESGLRLLAARGGEIKSYADGGMTEDDGSRLGARELGVAEMMPVGIATLPQAQAPEIEAKLPSNQPSEVNIDITQVKPQSGLMQQVEQGAPISELIQQQGGQGLNYQNMFGAPQAQRGYGPDGKMFAAGGPVSFASGGGLFASPAYEVAQRSAAQQAAIDAAVKDKQQSQQTQPWNNMSGIALGSRINPAAATTPAPTAPSAGLFATRGQEQQVQADYNARLAAAQRAADSDRGFRPQYWNIYGGQGRGNSIQDLARQSNADAAAMRNAPRKAYSTSSQPITGSRLNFGGRGMRLAAGGNIGTGGIADLYGASDAQIGPPLSEGGYGLSRLSNLAAEQAQNRAGAGNFSQGGAPTLEDGGFVVPADVVFYAGGHSTMEGQKKFADKYGGVPIKGPGNGLSDDIPTSIEGKQPARVADGEVYIPKRNVEAAGGAKKFYKMMDKVRKQAHGTKKQARPAKV